MPVEYEEFGRSRVKIFGPKVDRIVVESWKHFQFRTNLRRKSAILKSLVLTALKDGMMGKTINS